MSNSGTCTSCFADFIKLPSPALRASTSVSSLAGSSSMTDEAARSGEVARVGGIEGMSISISIDDRRRIPGPSPSIDLRDMEGLMGGGGAFFMFNFSANEDCRTTVGRSNDHDRTRSSARTWHPVRCKQRQQKNQAQTDPFCRIRVQFATQN